MSEMVMCLDTGVIIKAFVEEDPPELFVAAKRLMIRALSNGMLVAPAFVWAEVGSVFRKQIQRGILAPNQAQAYWDQFQQLPIEYIDTLDVRHRAWELASRYTLPTLYDAAFLACTELANVPNVTRREFWTADKALLRSLTSELPSYVQFLGST